VVYNISARALNRVMVIYKKINMIEERVSDKVVKIKAIMFESLNSLG
jgi:hypothetical protein